MSKCHQISGFGVSNHGKLLSELSFVITNNNQSSGAKLGSVDFFAFGRCTPPFENPISGDSYYGSVDDRSCEKTLRTVLNRHGTKKDTLRVKNKNFPELGSLIEQRHHIENAYDLGARVFKMK